MENIREINHLEIVRREFKTVLATVLIVVLLSLVVTLLQPFMYRASVSVMVLQKSSFSIDAYSAAKSEERTANKLSQIVYSSSFLQRVLQSEYAIDAAYFPTDELKKRKLWAKTIEAYVPSGYSRLDMAVYHPDPEQALLIASAVAAVLTNEKSDYIGISDVDLRVLDAPLATKYPVRPNVLVNVALALVIGLAIGSAYVIATYHPEKDRLLKIAKKEERVVPRAVAAERKSAPVPVVTKAALPMVPRESSLPSVPTEKVVASEKNSPVKEKTLPTFDEEGEIVGMPD